MRRNELYKDYEFLLEGTSPKKIKKQDNKKDNKKNKLVLKEENKIHKIKILYGVNTVVPIAVLIFALTIFMIFRYSTISEKNIEKQQLSKQLETVNSVLATTMIKYEKELDLENIELLAKQQYGMQTPTKNQIVYINISKNENVVEVYKKSLFQKILERLKIW